MSRISENGKKEMMASMKICLLTLAILLSTGKLPGEELQIACFNHFTSFFREFQRPGDMILSIRKMTEEEIGKQLEDGKLRLALTAQPPSLPDRFNITELAVTGVIPAVHPENPLKNISSENARRLLEAEIPNWHPLNGQQAKVHLYRTASALPSPQTLGCGKHPLHPPAETGSIRKKTEQRAMVLQTENHSKSFILLFVDPDGAAGLPLTSYKEDRIKLLPVDGVAPTLENFRNGAYPLVRKIYLVTAKQLTDSEKKIVSYIRSKAFAAQIYADGALPIEQKAEIK